MNNKKDIFSSSITIGLLKRLFNQYYDLENECVDTYYQSTTFKIINRFWQKCKLFARGSFLGRITDQDKSGPLIWEHSQIVKRCCSWYTYLSRGINSASQSSDIFAITKDLQQQFYYTPTQTLSMIIASAIIINVILVLVMQETVHTWGWIFRGLFVFSAFVLLFNRQDWDTIKRESILLRKICKK